MVRNYLELAQTFHFCFRKAAGEIYSDLMNYADTWGQIISTCKVFTPALTNTDIIADILTVTMSFSLKRCDFSYLIIGSSDLWFSRQNLTCQVWFLRDIWF